jgi:C4-dicarboxylate-specific signal transduction histidine kinase
VLVACADIGDLKRAEDARREAERRLEQQRALAVTSDRMRSLGEMAAGIAHELNQPLTGVRGMAEHVMLGLDRDWQFDRDNLRAKAARIVEQTDRMTQIIEHVRMFAKEAGKPELRRVKVAEVVDTSLSLVEAQLRERGIALERELADDLPEVMANPFSLEEIVLNLVSNARDAVESVPERTVRVRAQRRDLAGGEVRVVVEVSDRGPGIPDEDFDRVFEPFFTTKGPDKGTGLGLSICRSIVESFDGAIELETEPGRGTTVSVSLPAAPRPQQREDRT